MKLPKMSPVEAAVLAASFAREVARHSYADNSAAEIALDTAPWELQCFKQAVRDRKNDE